MDGFTVVIILLFLAAFLKGFYSGIGEVFFFDTRLVIFSLHVATTGWPPLWFYRTPGSLFKTYNLIQVGVLKTEGRVWGISIVLLSFLFHLAFPPLTKVGLD